MGGEFFDIAAVDGPLSADLRKAFFDIELNVGIGIWAGCVIDIEWEIELLVSIG